jgi:hypothetical protein
MNVYLVRDEERGGVLIFDAGEKGMAAAIVAAARPHGGISRVVLGHGDTRTACRPTRGCSTASRTASCGTAGRRRRTAEPPRYWSPRGAAQRPPGMTRPDS